MTLMTDEELKVIEERAAAAFCGPWTYTRFEIECRHDEIHSEDEVFRIESPAEYPDGQVVCDVFCDVPGLERFAEPNGKFIAHAREDIPKLLAEVRRLRNLIDLSEYRRANE